MPTLVSVSEKQRKNLPWAWMGAIATLICAITLKTPGLNIPVRPMLAAVLIATVCLIAALSTQLRVPWLERALCFVLGCSCSMLTVLLTS
jgi:hypothetical protein